MECNKNCETFFCRFRIEILRFYTETVRSICRLMRAEVSTQHHGVAACINHLPPTFSSYECKLEKRMKLAQDSIPASTFPMLLSETQIIIMKFRKNTNDRTFTPINLIMCENLHPSIFLFSMTPLHNTMKFWSMISHTSKSKSDIFLQIKTWPLGLPSLL